MPASARDISEGQEVRVQQGPLTSRIAAFSILLGRLTSSMSSRPLILCASGIPTPPCAALDNQEKDGDGGKLQSSGSGPEKTNIILQ
jgi:hypothetical protein